MSCFPRFAVHALAVALCLAAFVTPLPAQEPPARALGVTLDPRSATSLLPESAVSGSPWARISADWQAIESSPGVYDWSELRPLVDRLSARA